MDEKPPKQELPMTYKCICKEGPSLVRTVTLKLGNTTITKGQCMVCKGTVGKAPEGDAQ